MIAKMLRRAAGLAVLFLVVVYGLPGCSQRSATVSGTVNYQNRKVTSGSVVFVGADGVPSLPAPIREDGTYTATKVPTGTVKVAVVNPSPTTSTSGAPLPANDPEAQEAAREFARYVPTPPRYRDAHSSGLTTELKPGSNDYNIELK